MACLDSGVNNQRGSFIESYNGLYKYFSVAIVDKIDRLFERVEQLEAGFTTLVKENQEQTALIDLLKAEKQAATNEAKQNSKIAKVLALSFGFGIFVIPDVDFASSGGVQDITIKSKEIPLAVAGAYGLGVLALVLDKEQLQSIAGMMPGR